MVRSRGRGCAPVTANSDAPDSRRPNSMLIRPSQPQKRERSVRQRLSVWWSEGIAGVDRLARCWERGRVRVRSTNYAVRWHNPSSQSSPFAKGERTKVRGLCHSENNKNPHLTSPLRRKRRNAPTSKCQFSNRAEAPSRFGPEISLSSAHSRYSRVWSFRLTSRNQHRDWAPTIRRI